MSTPIRVSSALEHRICAYTRLIVTKRVRGGLSPIVLTGLLHL